MIDARLSEARSKIRFVILFSAKESSIINHVPGEFPNLNFISTRSATGALLSATCDAIASRQKRRRSKVRLRRAAGQNRTTIIFIIIYRFYFHATTKKSPL